MKRFILNYKLQVLAVGVLALAQVSSFMDQTSVNRHIAQELGTGTGTATVNGTVNAASAVSKNRESQILNAYKKYQDKSKECLVRVRDEDSLKSAFRDFKLDPSDLNIKALDDKLVEMGFLSAESSSSSSSSSNFRDQLLSLDSDDDKDSSSSSGAILDPDNKSDLKEIAKCHERRIKDLDTQAEKRAYFKKIESKFADMLAESDSKEIAALAREFQKTAKTADPNNALGLQTAAQMHVEYATLLANSMAEIKFLERQVALNPNDTLAQSNLKTARARLDSDFSLLQTRHMTSINPQDSDALEKMAALQSVSSFWLERKTSSLTGSLTSTSFGNTVNSIGITTDPVINGGLTGVSTLPSISSNLLTLPQTNTLPNANLMTVRTNNGRLNITDFSYYANPNNKVQNTAKAVPILNLPTP